MSSTPSPLLRSPGTLEPVTWSRGFAASAEVVAREFVSSRSLQPIKAVVLGPPGGHQSHVCKQVSSANVEQYVYPRSFSQLTISCRVVCFSPTRFYLLVRAHTQTHVRDNGILSRSYRSGTYALGAPQASFLALLETHAHPRFRSGMGCCMSTPRLPWTGCLKRSESLCLRLFRRRRKQRLRLKGRKPRTTRKVQHHI